MTNGRRPGRRTFRAFRHHRAVISPAFHRTITELSNFFRRLRFRQVDGRPVSLHSQHQRSSSELDLDSISFLSYELLSEKKDNPILNANTFVTYIFYYVTRSVVLNGASQAVQIRHSAYYFSQTSVIQHDRSRKTRFEKRKCFGMDCSSLYGEGDG